MAGEPAERAARAEVLAADGSAAAAWEEMDAAANALWTSLPLTVRKVVVVEQPAGGYGIYAPRGGTRFRDGEKMVVYVEPIGFGYGNDGLGHHLMALNFDIEIFDASGKKVFAIDNVGNIRAASRERNRELFINITMNFNQIPVGNYQAEFRIRDESSGKTGLFPLSFEIGE